jgi:hypothetical protein
MLGHAPNLARDTAIPLAPKSALTAWATEQRDLLCELGLAYDHAADYAAVLHRLGVSPGTLPICRTADGEKTYDELVEWIRPRRRIKLFDDADEYVEDLSAMHRMSLLPADDVIVYATPAHPDLSWFERATDDGSAPRGARGIQALILDAAMTGWGDWLMQEEENEAAVIGSSHDGISLTTEFYTDVERLDPEHPLWEDLQAEREHDDPSPAA